MRQNRFIATKDHFLIIAASNELGDELWAGHLEFRGAKFSTQTTNAMGFLVKGSVNSFINTSDQGEDWHHYAEASHPVMMIRDKGFTNFGIVSTSDETVFGSILTKKSVFSGQNEALVAGSIKHLERLSIESSEGKTVNVAQKCKAYQKRDLSTFEPIEQLPIDIHTISDSDIQIDIEEESP